VHAGLERRRDLGGHQHRRHRQTPAQRLAQHGEIGAHVEVLGGEQAARPPHAALDLVEDQRHAERGAARAQRLKELAGRRHRARFALDRLDDHRGHALVEGGLEAGDVVVAGEARARISGWNGSR